MLAFLPSQVHTHFHEVHCKMKEIHHLLAFPKKIFSHVVNLTDAIFPSIMMEHTQYQSISNNNFASLNKA